MGHGAFDFVRPTAGIPDNFWIWTGGIAKCGTGGLHQGAGADIQSSDRQSGTDIVPVHGPVGVFVVKKIPGQVYPGKKVTR